MNSLVKFKVDSIGSNIENEKNYCKIDLYCGNNKASYGYLIRGKNITKDDKFWIGKIIRYFVNNKGKVMPVIFPIDNIQNLIFSYSFKDNGFCLKNKNHSVVYLFETKKSYIMGNYIEELSDINFNIKKVFLYCEKPSIYLVLKIDNKFEETYEKIDDEVFIKRIFYMNEPICNIIYKLKEDTIIETNKFINKKMITILEDSIQISKKNMENINKNS